MKRFFCILTAFLMIGGLCSCSALSPSSFGEIPVSGTVLMDTQFPVYAKDTEQIQVALCNGSGETLEFGSRWQMEVYKDGTWMRIPFRENTAFHDLLYCLMPGGIHVFTVHTASLDYTLTEGTYRIVKQTEGDFGAAYSAEFTVGVSRVGKNSPYGYAPLESLPHDHYGSAYEDGVIYVGSLGQKDSTAVDAFFSQYKMCMNTQLRLAMNNGSGIILEDILCERKLGSWRIRYRRDETRCGGEITESIYSYLVSDGEEIYLSNEPQYAKDTAVQIPLLKDYDWIGHDSVKAWLKEQGKKFGDFDPLRPAFWSPDGRKLVVLHDEPLQFSLSQLHENGGEEGHMTGIAGMAGKSGMKKISSVLWSPDSETTVLVCETDRKGWTGYVSYSVAEDTVLSYTSSQYEPTFDADGNILIPE